MPKQQHYDRAFYQMQQSGSYRSACVIVPLMRDLASIGSVCDVGCGIGTWLRCWRESGVEDVMGIDGAYVDADQLMIPTANFQRTDLCQPIRLDRGFDLAMSMEVAEHLPHDRAAGLVADLTALAPLVLFSAAIPGQGGTEHVNERWPSYWAALFDTAGFAMFDVLRAAVWNDDDVEFWYRQNMLLFCRRDAISAYPALTAAKVGMPMSVVHPRQYMIKCDPRETLNTRQALGVLRMALRRAVNRRIARFWPRTGDHTLTARADHPASSVIVRD